MSSRNKLVVFFMIFVVIILSCSNNSEKIQSDHFELIELDKGVYAAIHKMGGGAICNAGAVDLGDEVLVFDTFMSLDAAQDLKDAVSKMIGKPVKYVVKKEPWRSLAP